MHIIKSGYGTFEHGSKIGPVHWPHADLFILHRGEIELTIQGRAHRLNSKSAVLIPANCEFYGQASAPSLASIFHFKLDRAGYSNCFAHLNKLLNTEQSTQVFKLSDLIENDIKRCLSLHASNSPQENTSSLFSFVLSELKNSSDHNSLKQPNSKFKRLLIEIDKTILQETTTAFWAGKMNMSESHFRHEFKKQVGTTLVNYKNHNKITLACEQLEQSSQSIQQIAYNLGFTELSSFYRLFKKITQQTPKQFRRSRNVFI